MILIFNQLAVCSGEFRPENGIWKLLLNSYCPYLSDSFWVPELNEICESCCCVDLRQITVPGVLFNLALTERSVDPGAIENDQYLHPHPH